MTNTFLDSIKVRRSIYALDKTFPLRIPKLKKLLKTLLNIAHLHSTPKALALSFF